MLAPVLSDPPNDKISGVAVGTNRFGHTTTDIVRHVTGRHEKKSHARCTDCYVTASVDNGSLLVLVNN